MNDPITTTTSPAFSLLQSLLQRCTTHRLAIKLAGAFLAVVVLIVAVVSEVEVHAWPLLASPLLLLALLDASFSAQEERCIGRLYELAVRADSIGGKVNPSDLATGLGSGYLLNQLLRAADPWRMVLAFECSNYRGLAVHDTANGCAASHGINFPLRTAFPMLASRT